MNNYRRLATPSHMDKAIAAALEKDPQLQTEAQRKLKQESREASEGTAVLMGILRQHAPDLAAVVMTDFKFSKDRKWSFDLWFPVSCVVVEIDGWGHQQDNRYFSDMDKYNEAAIQGYCILRTTHQRLRDDPLKEIEMIRRAVSA